MGTATAERKFRLFAIDGCIRESFSVSSHSATLPVSMHSLVKVESGCNREPKAGASPVRATHRMPPESRTATTAPLADIAEQICSTGPTKQADICCKLLSAMLSWVLFSGEDPTDIILVWDTDGLRMAIRAFTFAGPSQHFRCPEVPWISTGAARGFSGELKSASK
jgi:hypothetical protein